MTPPPRKGRKTKAKPSPSALTFHTPTRTFPLHELIDSSYYLSHMDVLKNMKDLSNCDECGVLLTDDYARACDGCFPSNAGVHWPEGGLGKQFHCFRGALCEDCDGSLPAENKLPGRSKEKYWLCKACLAPPSCHEDVWGYGIEQPPNSLRMNCLWMSSVPRAPLRVMEPADAHNAAEERRGRELIEADARYRLQGGQEAVDGAGHWIQLFKTLNISQGAQQQIITGVHAINDARLLVKPSSGAAVLNLPRKLETLQDRGASKRVLDKDAPVVHTKFCMQSMRQTKQECSVVRSDAATIIQSMLLGSIPIQDQALCCWKEGVKDEGNIVINSVMTCVALNVIMVAGGMNYCTLLQMMGTYWL